MTRIVLGISGASGTPLAVRTAEALVERVELVTVVSDGAKAVMAHETDDREETLARLEDLSIATYDEDEIAASIASGSAPVDGMAIVPASMNTIAAVASGRSDTLLRRAADVCLKERRRLVVVPRETPLSEIHLRNLHDLSQLGVDVVPPTVSFYHDPQDLDDLLDHLAGKVLERFGLEHDLYEPWGDLEG